MTSTEYTLNRLLASVLVTLSMRNLNEKILCFSNDEVSGC